MRSLSAARLRRSAREQCRSSSTPISSTLVCAVGFAGDSRPCAITARRSQISNSSSSSSEIDEHGDAASRRSISACRISAAAPTSTPQVGCATTAPSGASMISRPTMNFCRLPPDRLRAAASGPLALDVEALDHVARELAHASRADEAVPRPAAAGAREQRVLGERQRRHGAAAEPLFGHEVQPERAALRRRRAARPARRRCGSHRRAPSGPRPTARPAAPAGRCPRRRRCRRSRRRAPRGRYRAASCRTDRRRRERRAPSSASRASRPASRRLQLALRQVAADHQPRQAAAASPARGSHVAGDPAAAQHGRACGTARGSRRACG